MSVSTLTLIRGIPGTGKTTLSNLISKSAAKPRNCLHYEADEFFEKDSSYSFCPSLLSEAHSYCYGMTACALYKNWGDVIVSNTMCSIQEVQQYVNLAEKLLVNVIIIECTTQYAESPHGLTKQDMARFKRRWVPNSELRSKIKADNIRIFYVSN